MLPQDSIHREVVIKKEYQTKNKVSDKSISEILDRGIINLDKPSGPTSHDTATYVKKILGVKKTGHSGTLDPGVTGVLPISLNNATKTAIYLLQAGKEYVCLMYLHRDADEKRIIKTFEYFKGTIDQLPPVKSAIKRVSRKRTIYSIDILEIDGRNVLFKVGCEAGTYIRKLVHDFGLRLRTGANMQELRRVRVGPFDENYNLVNLQELIDAYQEYLEGNESHFRKIIIPVEKSVEHLPKVWVTDLAITTIRKGAKLAIPGVVKLNDDIKVGDNTAIFSLNDELIAVGKAEMDTKEILEKERGIAFSLKRVI